MSKINAIQSAILELDGGTFQKFANEFVKRRYNFHNITGLGLAAGSNKSTKGIPDSYCKVSSGKYVLIMYGTVNAKDQFKKLKKDVEDCLNINKVGIEKGEVEKIICVHTVTNITITQSKELENMAMPVLVELIGLEELSGELMTLKYQHIAKDFLNIPIDTDQILTLEDFIKESDKNKMSAPLDIKFFGRAKKIEELYSFINENEATLVTGSAGVGKTRLVLEVCKKFKNDKWKVLCIKNNGKEIYEDLKLYILDDGKYLLFLDDANKMGYLETIIGYVERLNSNDNIEIKLVLTVRDYVKERVEEILKKHFKPKRINIDVLTDDEIKEIVKNNLNIKNCSDLNEIAHIAKGNCRLAILAGKIKSKDDYKEIKSVVDIYDSYYGEILGNLDLADKLINSLFFIALFGKIRILNDDLLNVILNLVNVDFREFKVICNKLNDMEVIDLYENEVAQLSDQSLGDYLFYYILVKKRKITISKILKAFFPMYKNRIIYMIETLKKSFPSEEVDSCIKKDVNKVWKDLSEDDEWEYVKLFYNLNGTKSISFLNKRIKKIAPKSKLLTKDDFETDKNRSSIESDEIEILSDFKYTDLYNSALEIMLIYFDKRPDLLRDFYIAFVNKLAYDEKSFLNKYKSEIEIIERLFKHSNGGKCENTTMLMIEVFKGLLKSVLLKQPERVNFKNYEIKFVQVKFNEGIKKIHSLIWSILFEVYSIDKYKDMIEELIATFYDDYDGYIEYTDKKLLLYDIEFLKKTFFNSGKSIKFGLAFALSELEQQCKNVNLKDDKFFSMYLNNKDFVSYKTLTDEHYEAKDGEEQKYVREKSIITMVNEFDCEDYKRLFDVCAKYPNICGKYNYILMPSISFIFTYLEKDSKKYIAVVKKYLESGIPFCSNQNIVSIIRNLIKLQGSKETKDLIDILETEVKNKVMLSYWKIIPVEAINSTMLSEFKIFLKSKSVVKDLSFPNVLIVNKFIKIDKDIVNEVAKNLIENESNNKILIKLFLGEYFNENDINELLEIFKDKIELLEKLYILAIGKKFDFKGQLLLKIIEKDELFWSTFVKELGFNKNNDSYERKFFNEIWKKENYKHLIEIAFNALKNKYNYINGNPGKILFGMNDQDSDELKNRKKEWVKEYIRKNINDNEKIILIFSVISMVLANDMLEYLKEFLKASKNIELFKSIKICSFISSWVGSETSRESEKINFLEELLTCLVDYDFLEHRQYVEGLIEELKKEKKESSIREAIRERDFM